MFDEQLREVKEILLRGVAKYLNFNPTLVTLIAAVNGIICCYFVHVHQYNVALFFWIVNRILDGLDGVIARVHQRQSDFGGLIDLYTDFVVYCFFIIAYAQELPLAMGFCLSSYTINLGIVNNFCNLIVYSFLVRLVCHFGKAKDYKQAKDFDNNCNANGVY